MSTDIVYSAVRAFVEANWTLCPVAWENEQFQRPEPPSPFVLLEIFGDAFDQVSIGSGAPASELWREEGAVLGYFLVPEGTGSLVARQLATAWCEMLRGLELPGTIRFGSMSIGTGGPGDDSGAWWCLAARADWRRN